MNNNVKPFYLIKLHGHDLFAKISLDKIDLVIKYKWYLGQDGYPFAYIKCSRVPLHRFIWYLNTQVYTNNQIDETGKITKLYVDHITPFSLKNGTLFQ